MSYEKITFVDRIAEYPTRRKLTTIDTQQPFGTYDVSRDEGTVSQEGTALNAATFNALQANVESAFVEVDDNIASAYDETSTYAQGDFCIYEGVLYQANQDIETAEEWDSTHWDSVKLTDIMGTGSASIDDTIVASDKTWSSEHIASFLPEDSASGAIASFPDGANDIPLKSLTCTLNPVQSGSGDPSPSNIRPITGHNDVTITQSGVNIWDEEWESGDISIVDGSKRVNANRVRSANFIPVKPNTTYYSKNNNTNTIICFYDDNKSWVSDVSGVGYVLGTNRTFTTPGWCYYIMFYSAVTSYNNDVSINYPSTDTSYHAYNGTNTTITFPDTVYGASLDVTTGVLTIDRAEVDMGNLSYTKFDVAEGTLFRTQINGAKTTTDTNNVVCSAYRWVPKANRTNGTVSIPDSLGNIDFINDSYSDASDFKTAMTGQKVVYELATPTTTQLTPEQLNSILGENNFYHDGNGEISVTYKADIGLYIDKKTS